MTGAIIGDIIGSTYEFKRIKTKRFLLFPLFSAVTDDSVMTIAICKAIMECNGDHTKLSQKTIENMQYFGKEVLQGTSFFVYRFEKLLYL